MENATREQIVSAVNQNSAKIQSLTATGAAITIPDSFGLPILTGNIAAERPGLFRLTAGTSFGQEIDLGSNEELFWLWARRNHPPAVYICRHTQFANSAIRQVMPVEPAWFLAAVGMVDIDVSTVFDGPVTSPRSSGMVELRTWLHSTGGTLQRVLVIDARRAWVLEQHIYDLSGATLLASAVAESYRYYPVEQVSLPERLSIRLPTAGIAFKINLGEVRINQLPGDRAQLWALPTFEGYPQYDLGGAALGTPLPGQSGVHPRGALLPSTVLTTGFHYPTTSIPPTASPKGFEATRSPETSTSAVTSVPAFLPLPQYGQRRPSPPTTRPRY